VVYSSRRATIQPTWGRFDLLPLPLRVRGSAGIRLRPEKHTTPGLIYLTTQEAWLALDEQPLQDKLSLGINILDKIDGSDSMAASRFEKQKLTGGLRHLQTSGVSPNCRRLGRFFDRVTVIIWGGTPCLAACSWQQDC